MEIGIGKPYKNQWPEDREKSPGVKDRHRRRAVQADTEERMEEDGYCEHCDAPNPTFPIDVAGPADTMLMFCDGRCADEYAAAR